MTTQQSMVLRADADTSHESARDWYLAYGYCYQDEADEYDLQTVEYDWLDNTDDAVVVLLTAKHPEMAQEAAEALVQMARTVRKAAEAIEAALERAVAAYGRGDMGSVLEALDEAADEERQHGDAPASNSLREAMIREVSYRIFTASWNGACYSTDSCEDSDATDLDEAIAEADEVAEGLDDGDDDDIDAVVTVKDDEGTVLYTRDVTIDRAEQAQDAMDETWEDIGAYTTQRLGVRHARGSVEWCVWRANGGHRGAFDRMTNRGWVERYEMPRVITTAEAVAWLVEHEGMDAADAVTTAAEAEGRETWQILVDHADRIGSIPGGSSSDGVYLIAGQHYTVDGDDIEAVDEDTARAAMEDE